MNIIRGYPESKLRLAFRSEEGLPWSIFRNDIKLNQPLIRLQTYYLKQE